MRKLICLLFGHKEWNFNNEFPFMQLVNTETNESYKLAVCKRCKAVFGTEIII